MILSTKRLNLSLFTDRLRAEREQGITIDVAYRYFATPARKFIIADTAEHIQYNFGIKNSETERIMFKFVNKFITYLFN